MPAMAWIKPWRSRQLRRREETDVAGKSGADSGGGTICTKARRHQRSRNSTCVRYDGAAAGTRCWLESAIAIERRELPVGRAVEVALEEGSAQAEGSWLARFWRICCASKHGAAGRAMGTAAGTERRCLRGGGRVVFGSCRNQTGKPHQMWGATGSASTANGSKGKHAFREDPPPCCSLSARAALRLPRFPGLSRKIRTGLQNREIFESLRIAFSRPNLHGLLVGKEQPAFGSCWNATGSAFKANGSKGNHALRGEPPHRRARPGPGNRHPCWQGGLVTPRGNEEDAVYHEQSQGEDLMRIKTYLEAKKGVNGWVEGR